MDRIIIFVKKSNRQFSSLLEKFQCGLTRCLRFCKEMENTRKCFILHEDVQNLLHFLSVLVEKHDGSVTFGTSITNKRATHSGSERRTACWWNRGEFLGRARGGDTQDRSIWCSARPWLTIVLCACGKQTANQGYAST